MSKFWKTILSAVSVLALLSVAGFAVATAPNSERVTAPFELHGEIGETIEARELSVTVDGVRLGETLSATYAYTQPDTSTEGVWVVVDATVVARSGYISLSSAKLRIGDYAFGSSDILPAPRLIDFYQSSPGLPVTGSLVFEVPSFVLDLPDASNATVVFATAVTPSLDTVPMIRVDLSGSPSPSVAVEAAQLGGVR